MGNCTSQANSHRKKRLILNYNDDETIEVDQPVKVRETIDFGKEVTLSLRLAKKTIQSSSSQDQTFPLLVSLAAKDLKSYKAPIDLVCVIDFSGSMKGQKMKLVKDSLMYLFKCLDESDRLSVVTFNSDTLRLFPLIQTTEANKEKILSALKKVKGDGGTNINLGMMNALKILKERRYTKPVSSIFLLSDGLDDGAENSVQESLKRFNLSNEITINTFGFGSDHDPELMSKIADLRDGNFYSIKELDTVNEAFVDCLGGLITSMAKSVEIKIKSEHPEVLPGVEIVRAYGKPSMWKYENGFYITRISNLISGTQKDL